MHHLVNIIFPSPTESDVTTNEEKTAIVNWSLLFYSFHLRYLENKRKRKDPDPENLTWKVNSLWPLAVVLEIYIALYNPDWINTLLDSTCSFPLYWLWRDSARIRRREIGALLEPLGAPYYGPLNHSTAIRDWSKARIRYYSLLDCNFDRLSSGSTVIRQRTKAATPHKPSWSTSFVPLFGARGVQSFIHDQQQQSIDGDAIKTTLPLIQHLAGTQR